MALTFCDSMHDSNSLSRSPKLTDIRPSFKERSLSRSQSFSLKSNVKGHEAVTYNLLNDTVPQTWVQSGRFKAYTF